MDEARKTVAETVIPAGSYIEWSGQYENEIRARQRLQIVVPVVLAVIYVLLYVTYHSFLEAAHVLLAVPFALSGGIYLLYAWDTTCRWRSGWASSPFWHGGANGRGHGDLSGRGGDAQTPGAGGRLTPAALLEAVTEGALLRLRPK